MDRRRSTIAKIFFLFYFCGLLLAFNTVDMSDMMKKITGFAKSWSLPLGITLGVVGYLSFHFVGFLAPLKPAVLTASGHLVPALLVVMLFLTFCKVSPREMKVRKWHLQLAVIQVVSCAAIAVPLHFFPDFPAFETAEGAMVCFVCPTATAAAVITGRLGGNEASLTTYTMISNIVAAVAIPLFFPLVGGADDLSFGLRSMMILGKVFPMLILPFIAAMLVRRFFRRIHAFILKRCSGLAFYLWAFSLIMVIGQALRSVVNSGVSSGMLVSLFAAGLVTCVLQFAVGKAVGGRYGDRISAGQGLGQKNTVFAIWISVACLSPEVAIAPSSYILWQNLINSWQLWRKQRRDRTNV